MTQAAATTSIIRRRSVVPKTAIQQEIEDTFLETVRSAGPDGLRVSNENCAIALCEALGFGLQDREQVLKVVNSSDVAGQIKVTHEGDLIQVEGSKGGYDTVPAFRVFRLIVG